MIPEVKNYFGSTRYLLGLLWAQRTNLAIGLIALALGSSINLFIPQLVRQVINGDFGDILQQQPFQIALWLISLFVIQSIFFYLRSYYFYALGQKVTHRLRDQALQRVLLRTTAFFDASRISDLTARIINDAQVVQDIVSMRLSVIIRYGLQVLAGVVLMCLLSLQLSLILALILPLIMLVAFFLGRRLKSHSRKLQDRTAETAIIIEESLGNIKLVKAFGQEALINSNFSSSNQQVLALGLERSRISAFFSSFVGLLMNVAIVVVLLFGYSLANRGEISFGDLTAFLLYGAIVATSFAFVVTSIGEFLQGLGALDRIVELSELNNLNGSLNTQKPIVDYRKNRVNLEGQITFEAVSFSYPQRDSFQVLDTINLNLAPRTSTALVGASGAGKTSLAMLVLGLYLPTSGRITLDGLDLVSIDPDYYHQLTAYVPQDPVLFAQSIRDNILFGNPKASTEELLEACRRAHVLDFADKLPQGLDTICGERGHQLSGGERQRVAIARALIRRPLILVLDEPTSALDSFSEELIRNTIDQLKSSCTILIIAHRLSTVQNVDQLVVLNAGRVIQSGIPTQLENQPGAYKQLLEGQQIL